MTNILYVYSCGEDTFWQPVDHGSSDASLPVDGGDRHGGLHPLSEEQGHLQNWCLQDLQNPLKGRTVNLHQLHPFTDIVSCYMMCTPHLTFFFVLSTLFFLLLLSYFTLLCPKNQCYRGISRRIS